jgi:hypothetical protein
MAWRHRFAITDTRPEWVKWIAPTILGISGVTMCLANGAGWACLLVANALVAHLEGISSARFIRRDEATR